MLQPPSQAATPPHHSHPARRIAASSVALALGVTLCAATTATPAHAADGTAPSAPTRLTVEDQPHPLEVDGTPRFGWLPQDVDGNEVQTAYEIEVRGDDDQVVWDSGKVDSDQQAYVDYDGADLDPGTAYDWTVRTWDRGGQVSPWAPEATFETGLEDGDWGGAQWIRRQPGSLTGALQVQDGQGRHTGAGITVAKAGRDWTDYTLDVDITPRRNSAGIVLRAPDAANGYMVALVPGTGVRHHLLQGGTLPNTSGARVTFPATVAVDTTYHLTVRVVGDTITYLLDGTELGQVTRTNWATGTVGFRTASGETADYDNLVVTGPDDETLFSEDFSSDLAKWERSAGQEPDEFTFARKQVTLPAGTITRARSWFAADDTYELWVNGTRADRGSNLGYQGSATLQAEQYYQTADLTVLLRPGRQTVFGVVSRWSGSGQGRAAGTPGLLGRVVVEYADGSEYVVTTDGTWRTRPGDFVGVGTRNGEGLNITHQDARLTVAAGAWKRPGYDDSTWGAPIVIGEHPVANTFNHLSGRQTRVTETVVRPERILIAQDGTPVADFGKVIPARPAVHFEDGLAGRTIPVRASFLLEENGRVSTSGVATQGTDMRFLYTQVDGEQDFQAFDHLAYRYLEIPGAGEDITVDDVSATVLHTRLPGEAATFESDDPTLNAVWDLMDRSLVYSVQDTFVDTPTREQGQFLLDTANISYGLMATQNERVATRVAMREFLASQERYWSGAEVDKGRYNAVYPNGDGKRDIPDFTALVPDWVWRYYQETGDRDLLAEAYPAMAETAGYIRRHVATSGATQGLVTELTGGSGQYLYGIVDWPASGRFDYDMTATARTTVNALGVNVLRTAALMAEELGEPGAEAYDADADAIADRMNAVLRQSDGSYHDGIRADGTSSPHAGQHATSYAIAFGIAPGADRPELAKRIGAMGMKQGPMTSHWLLKALGDGGAERELRSLLTNADDLGWAKTLKDGGTFTPEAWVAEGSANSLSHGWGSQAIVDIQQDVLGVDLTGAGASDVALRIPDTGLTHAAGTRPTQRGPVSTDWTRRGSDVTLTAGLPVNVEGVVSLPVVAGRTYAVRGPRGATATPLETVDGQQRWSVGSGTWTFSNVRATPPTPPNPPSAGRVSSTTKLTAERRKNRVLLVARVRAEDGARVKGGTVVFRSSKGRLGAATVKAQGRARIWVPRQVRPGRIAVRALFQGTKGVKPSRSARVIVRVRR
ncbi:MULTISPECIES: family 78 glycoside hydrolase catalytic domain [unclassified Nocardioides]|uniref:family 78 glycoside hydrolase catalytic domain n=1 Tax=unclassified Nocardioides TaxID=2615069 RepID=UPI0030148391